MSTVEQFFWPWGAWSAWGPWRAQGDFAVRGLRQVTEPALEQLTVDEVAMHLRLDQYGSPPEYPEQAWLEAAIIAAREFIEGRTGLLLAAREVELGPSAPGASAWCCCPTSTGSGISLQTAPVLGLTSITYFDGTQDQTADISGFTIDPFVRPPMLYPAYGGSWPASVTTPQGAMRIRFNAGYTAPGDSPNDVPLPKALRAAMLLMIGHLYEEREAVSLAANIQQIPLGIDALIEQYRIRNSLA